MSSIRVLMGMAVMLSAGSAHAQSTAAPPPSPSQFCGVSFLIGIEKALAKLQKCQPGDTVLIPARFPDVVVRFCDFTKSMVSTGGDIACVLQGGDRTFR